MKTQRLRITFGRSDDMKYISHLDMMRFWERALRRAEIPVSYSEGFSPHAQISLAAPLAIGTTSEAELMDVFLDRAMIPKQFIHQVTQQLPAGITIMAAQEVGLALPSLQADIRFAEYIVDIEESGGAGPDGRRDLVARAPAAAEAMTGDSATTDGSDPPRYAPPAHSPATAEAAVTTFLAADTISWQHKRENDIRSYDIRGQVVDIVVDHCNDRGATLRMRLKNDNTGSGRPEQVVAALGLPPPTRIHRTKLILENNSPAREAWRKHARSAE